MNGIDKHKIGTRSSTLRLKIGGYGYGRKTKAAHLTITPETEHELLSIIDYYKEKTGLEVNASQLMRMLIHRHYEELFGKDSDN